MQLCIKEIKIDKICLGIKLTGHCVHSVLDGLNDSYEIVAYNCIITIWSKVLSGKKYHTKTMLENDIIEYKI